MRITKATRQFVQIMVHVVFLLTVAIISISCSKKNISTIPSEPVQLVQKAELVYLEGTVTIDGNPAIVGSEILDDSVVVTGAESLAEIVFNGKNAIRLGSKTIVSGIFSDLSKNVDIQQGTVTAVLRKLDKVAGGSLEVKTPTVVAGVRGTSFCVWVSADETYFCTCNGSLTLTPAQGGEAIFSESSHHLAKIIRKSSSGLEVITPPEGYNHRHTDADLERLASRIGEIMDWTTIED